MDVLVDLDGTHDHKHELIAHIFASQRVRPETAIMVGDREHDVFAAVHNSLRTVGVTWGYGSVEELTAAGAASLCHLPSHLAETVLQSFAGPEEIPTPVQLSHR